MHPRSPRLLSAALATTMLVACQTSRPPPQAPASPPTAHAEPTPPPATPAATPTPDTASTTTAATPVTLPLLDAMFADPQFAGALKSRVQLSDAEVASLRACAHKATTALQEATPGSTSTAARDASDQIRGILGADKTDSLIRFIHETWRTDEDGNPITATLTATPNTIPADTRIVVNAPEYRMDVFRAGELVKTYKIGIGYPEFPLPTGLRSATTIIVNPTWTPPDEPWVTGDVEAGKKVEAGSKQNPLGPIKIPIGMPSLIHGGKANARLGGFASHGCVGLTDVLVEDFAATLAEISSTPLTPAELAAYADKKSVTKRVRLAAAIPVELRYETIVVEAGKLKILRDVYERGTNTEANLDRALQAVGLGLGDLSDAERTTIAAALQAMSLDAHGHVAGIHGDEPATGPDVTTKIKGAKQVVVEVAALAGKGYPAPHPTALLQHRRGAHKLTWW